MTDKLVIELYRVFFLEGEERGEARGQVLAFPEKGRLPRLFIFLSFLHGLVRMGTAKLFG